MEIWRPISGYENYTVSNQGRVKNIRTNIMRNLSTDTDGYHFIQLSKNGHVKGFRVHRLVALAFIGDPPVGHELINHKDGNRQNNCVENLEWCSAKENAIHSIEVLNRRILRGEQLNNNRLTENQVIEMRELKRNGATLNSLVQRFNVSLGAVYDVIYRRTWKHLP